MTADGGIRFGNYVLLRRIARGGMAEVFLANQRGLEGFDRRVAVKRILPHLDDSPDFVKMFLGEAKLAALLSHPNIVHIYEFGKVEHDYFIAMEYVEGVHAGQLFKQTERDRMSPTLIARIGADAAAALHYAHELHGPTGQPLGLVHRDVSPANLMISFDGIVKLCDFGIAKAAAVTDQRTMPGQVKGKYAYMSPEQTVGAPLDGRSDVFALAIVLWELLAGKTIVPRGDAVAAMRAIRDGKLQPLALAVPGTPAPLADAIAWGLATRREERATAAELATALEAFIKASPELGTPMQVGAWVRGRFPREALTGPQRALSDPAAGPSTVAAPGTVAGEALATPGAAGAPGSAGARLIPVTPLSREVDEMSETLAIIGDPEAGAATLFVEEKTRRVSRRITARHLPVADPEDATLRNDPSLRAAIEAVMREPPPMPAPHADEPEETTRRSSGPRRIVSSSASQPRLPPRAQSGSGGRAAPAMLGTETVAHARPPRRLAVVGGLVAIAAASFVIALLVCSPQREAPAPDAAVAAPAAADAPPDAAAPPDAPAAATDAAPKLQLYKVDTRPTGGTLLVDDQRAIAPAELMLPPGKHTVVAELDGWQQETREIEIVDGVDLTHEIPFTRRIHIVRDEPTGTLTVRTTPYSDVYIGTRKIGQTPFADKEVPAGTYWLTFKNPLHPTVKKQVTILPGKLLRLSPFNLPPPE